MDKLEKTYAFALALTNLTTPFAACGPFALNLNGLEKDTTPEAWMQENYEIISGVLYAASVLSAELQDTLDALITEEMLRT